MTNCTCEKCMPNVLPMLPRFIVCSICGNKRCPHATDHENECTNSNEPGQIGSRYGNFKLDLNLLNDGVKVVARFATRDDAEGTAPEWSDPQVVTLYVKRSEKEYKRGKINRPVGTILELIPKEFAWASYTADDYCEEYNEFLAEEYRMQILSIVTEPN